MNEKKCQQQVGKDVIVFISIIIAIIYTALSTQGIHLRGCHTGANAAEMFGWNLLNSLSLGTLGMTLWGFPRLYRGSESESKMKSKAESDVSCDRCHTH